MTTTPTPSDTGDESALSGNLKDSVTLPPVYPKIKKALQTTGP